jgi:hypothetical protein
VIPARASASRAERGRSVPGREFRFDKARDLDLPR